MNNAVSMQLMVSAYQIAKSLYAPMLREPLKKAVESTDHEIDDKVFAVVDTIMTGKMAVSDEAAASLIMSIYCPYLRAPLKALTESTGTKADDIAFQVVDMVLGQGCVQE